MTCDDVCVAHINADSGAWNKLDSKKNHERREKEEINLLLRQEIKLSESTLASTRYYY